MDAILIKTDSIGNQQWANYYGGSGNDGSYSLNITIDNGYALAGYTFNFGAQNDDAMLIKTDSAGNQQWLKIFGGAGNDRALSVRQTIDKGFCFGGSTNSYGNGSDDMYLVKTDSLGNISYYKTFGGVLSDKAYSIDLTHDNGFVLAGETNSFGAGSSDLYVVKTDTAGNLLWQNFFGGAENDMGFTVKTTNDNGYIVIGNTYSYGVPTWSDIFLVKTDSVGFASDIIDFKNNYLDVLIYPNPVVEKFHIFSNNNTEQMNISIMNTQGQLLMHRIVSTANTEINISDFANGIYFLHINAGNYNCVKKIIKE